MEEIYKEFERLKAIYGADYSSIERGLKSFMRSKMKVHQFFHQNIIVELINVEFSLQIIFHKAQEMDRGMTLYIQ